jgi:hypothetical protein
MARETAYCDQCRELHWINDVISDTLASPSGHGIAKDDGHTPEGTRLRRVRFECGNQTNVISRYVPRG